KPLPWVIRNGSTYLSMRLRISRLAMGALPRWAICRIFEALTLWRRLPRGRGAGPRRLRRIGDQGPDLDRLRSQRRHADRALGIPPPPPKVRAAALTPNPAGKVPVAPPAVEP